MSPVMRLALPMLAAAGSAYAACSVSGTTTIQNSGDATGLASCKTFKGSVAIQTDAPGPIELNGVGVIDGNLVLKNNSQISSLSADSLTEITGSFELDNDSALGNLNFPKLAAVNSFQWMGLPQLYNMAFAKKVSKASTVRIENTNLQSLDGIDIETVETMFIANNPFISSIEMKLTNITNSLILTANNPDVIVKFDNLESANNMTFRNCSEISLDSLTELFDSLSLIGNVLTEFNAPNLTKIGGALAITSNFELKKLKFPELTEVGKNLEIQNNTKLQQIDGLPKLKIIYADLDFYGNFSKVDLPALTDVRAAFNIQSTGDIKKVCDEVFEPLKNKDKIRGEYLCEGKVDNPGDSSTTPTTSNGDKTTKKGAASSLKVTGGAVMVGLVAAFFL